MIFSSFVLWGKVFRNFRRTKKDRRGRNLRLSLHDYHSLPAMIAQTPAPRKSFLPFSPVFSRFLPFCANPSTNDPKFSGSLSHSRRPFNHPERSLAVLAQRFSTKGPAGRPDCAGRLFQSCVCMNNTVFLSFLEKIYLIHCAFCEWTNRARACIIKPETREVQQKLK